MKLFFPFIFFLTLSAKAQHTEADTALLAKAKMTMIGHYNTQMTEQTRLINGSKYLRIDIPHYGRAYNDNEHPYYQFDWLPGSVLYDGEWYNAPLIYDIKTNQLITTTVHGNGKLQLVNQLVTQFKFDNKHFIKLESTKLPLDFYEIVHNGNTKLYIRRQKISEEKFVDNKMIQWFVLKMTYYIEKDNIFYEVKSAHSVLRVLSDKKASLKKLIRLKKHSFRNDRINSIKEVVQAYDKTETNE